MTHEAFPKTFKGWLVALAVFAVLWVLWTTIQNHFQPAAQVGQGF